MIPTQKLLALAAAALLASSFLATANAQETQVVYDNALQSGWQDYGWATLSYSATTAVHSGTYSISVTCAQGYQALFLHHNMLDSSPYQSLRFWINGGASGGQHLQVSGLRHGALQQSYSLPALVSGSWQQITIPLSTLGLASCTDFDGVWIQSSSAASLPTFYVDDIALVGPTPPSTVQLSVDPQSVARVMDDRIYGINVAMWDWLLSGTVSRNLLSAINTRIFRFPGGSRSDDYHWNTNRSISDNIYWGSHAGTYASLTTGLGAQAMVTVNYGNGTPEEAAAWVAWANASPGDTTAIGVDARGVDWKTSGYWASLRAASPLATDDGFNFLRISRSASLAWKYWEIGNEIYGSWEGDQHGVSGSGLSGVAHDPYTYAQWFASFYQRMLAVDPNIKIGAVAVASQDDYGNGTHPAANPNENNATHTGWSPVMLATLKSLGVTPHFLIHHFYPQNGGEESDPVLLQTGAILASDCATLRKLLTDYIGGNAAAGVELDVTEINSVSSSTGKQTTSLVNGLFMADSLGTLSLTEFNACTWWDLRNGPETSANMNPLLYGWRQFGDYGLVASSGSPGTAADTPFPSYYAAKLLTHWGRGGDLALSCSSSYPWLSIHAARRSDGKLALLVVNKSASTDLSAQINLGGYVPSTGAGMVWSYGKATDLANGDLVTGTVSGVSSTLSYTFPSYSMTVIQLDKPAPANLTWVGGITASGTNVWNAIGNRSWSSSSLFTQGDNVAFTDSGATPVVLSGTLLPSTVTVNAAKDYALTGSGVLSGTMALVKTGSGTLSIPGTHSYTGATSIQSGTLKLTGTLLLSPLAVSSGATLQLAGGSANGSVTLNAGSLLTGTGSVGSLLNSGLAEIRGATLSVTGSALNSGTMRLLGGATLKVSGTFTNNGVLDIITAGALPAHFVNHGIVIDSSAVKIQQIALSAGNVQLALFGYAGHTYQLQRRTSLASDAWANIGAPQFGNDAMLFFTDPGVIPAQPQGFYRVILQP